MIGKVIPFLIALLITVTSATAEEVNDDDRARLWNGCKPTKLVVESLDDDAENINLTKEAIEIAVRSRLRAARLYTTIGDGRTYLYINITVTSRAHSINIEYNKIMIDGITGLSAYATTWITSSVGTHGGGSHYILGLLAEHVDRFIDEYLRVNADACGSP